MELLLRATGQLQTGPLVNVNMHGMPSPASGGTAEPEFTAWQLGDLLASLDPAKLQEALAIAQQIHADNAAAESIAENSLRPVQALSVQTTPANLLAETHKPSGATAAAGPVTSRFQPGRMPGT